MSDLADRSPDRANELDRGQAFRSWSAQVSLNTKVITKADGAHIWHDDGTGRCDQWLRVLDRLGLGVDS